MVSGKPVKMDFFGIFSVLIGTGYRVAGSVYPNTKLAPVDSVELEQMFHDVR